MEMLVQFLDGLQTQNVYSSPMSDLTEYRCQRERAARKGYTHLRVAPGTGRVVKRHPMIAPQAWCGFVHVVPDGADAIEEYVTGEETRG